MSKFKSPGTRSRAKVDPPLSPTPKKWSQTPRQTHNTSRGGVAPRRDKFHFRWPNATTCRPQTGPRDSPTRKSDKMLFTGGGNRRETAPKPLVWPFSLGPESRSIHLWGVNAVLGKFRATFIADISWPVGGRTEWLANRAADGDGSRLAAVKVINPSQPSTILSASTTCGVNAPPRPRGRSSLGPDKAQSSPGCVGTAFPLVHFGLLVSAGIGALTKSCRDRNFEGFVSYVSDRKELFTNL